MDTFDYIAQVEVVPIWTAVSLSGLTWRSPYVSGWSSLFMIPLCILAPLIAGQSVCVQIALGELDPLKMSVIGSIWNYAPEACSGRSSRLTA